MKVYAFANNTDIAAAQRAEWISGMAIAEDGTICAQHVHSSLAWCRADLSREGLRGKDIRKIAGDDCEIEFVEPSEVKSHPGLRAAIEAYEAAARTQTTPTAGE